jgi:hypothetical protein
MHHRPPSALSALLRAARVRSSAGLSRHRGALLTLALALAVLAGTALTGQAADAAPAGGAVMDAAASRAVQAADAPDRTRANGRHQGDHQRETRPPGTPADAAPTANSNCTLTVPPDPLSAAGLATPYELVATDRTAGPCHEANADQSAFVEAAIFDPATSALSIYHPLVVDRHDRPAVPPVPVALPAGATVGIWFGFNGDTLTLGGPGASSCVNGLPGSPFGQFAYCNAAALFSAAAADPVFQASIPELGTSPKDGLPCPTSRDFSVVDQDQSDNLATTYRLIHGRMAQLTPTTTGRGTALTNGSDEGLVARFIAPALGCRPFTAPDLTNGGSPTPALALNELLAAARQSDPALVPTSDPMVQVDGARSDRKTNLYRAGVGMPPLPAGQTPRAYCTSILEQAPARLAADATFLRAAASPAPESPNLLAFLQDRLASTFELLGCQTGGTGDAPGAGRPGSTPAAGSVPGAASSTSSAEAPSATVPATTPAPGDSGAGEPPTADPAANSSTEQATGSSPTAGGDGSGARDQAAGPAPDQTQDAAPAATGTP